MQPNEVPTFAPPPKPAGGDVRLMSFNVWYGNGHFKEIADLIQEQVDPDIVNLQEAVNHQPAAIVEELNKKHIGEWKLANEFSTEHFWCGLNAYRSDIWEVEWTKSIQYQGTRGICGARLRRKSDGRRLCAWGTHPTWWNGEKRAALEAVKVGAAAMKECAQDGAVSALMCDCNTFDAGAINKQLESSTGWNWKVAHADAYDQIYIQTGPGSPRNGEIAADETAVFASPLAGHTIAGGAGPRGCQGNCQNREWAGSDHPPVFAEVHLE